MSLSGSEKPLVDGLTVWVSPTVGVGLTHTRCGSHPHDLSTKLVVEEPVHRLTKRPPSVLDMVDVELWCDAEDVVDPTHQPPPVGAENDLIR